MSNLLTLTFHKPTRLRSNGQTSHGLLNEDILFKHHAIASGLVAGESMGELVDVPKNLRRLSGRPYTGIDGAELKIDSIKTEQVSLFDVGKEAWNRDGFRRVAPTSQSDFERYLNGVFSKPASCLVLCGHHRPVLNTDGPILDGYCPVIWGDQREERVNGRTMQRVFSALIAKKTKTSMGETVPALQFAADPPGGGGSINRTGLFNMKTALSQCRLIIVMGCRGTERTNAELWQEWVKLAGATRKPLVLGWWQLHSMPRDRLNEHFSEVFWQGLASMAKSEKVSDLDGLTETQARRSKIIKIWGAAMQSAFGGSTKCQKHLWYDSRRLKTPCRVATTRGAGAFDTDGQEWRVTDSNGPIREYSP